MRYDYLTDNRLIRGQAITSIVLLSIKLPSMMDLKVKSPVRLEVDDNIDLKLLLSEIEATDWGKEIVEKGMVKPPFGLIIDGELIMTQSNPQIDITSDTQIRFIPVISGGSMCVSTDRVSQ